MLLHLIQLDNLPKTGFQFSSELSKQIDHELFVPELRLVTTLNRDIYTKVHVCKLGA